jgi:hypothetical protein
LLVPLVQQPVEAADVLGGYEGREELYEKHRVVYVHVKHEVSNRFFAIFL